jgi:repressor LexA
MPIEAETITNGNYYYLRVSGDSMAPRIESGDHVLIRVGQTCDNGQIAVVMVGDEATLKRVHFQGDFVVLHSDNPAYVPFTFHIREIQIYGCVRKIIKDVR